MLGFKIRRRELGNLLLRVFAWIYVMAFLSNSKFHALAYSIEVVQFSTF